MRTFLTLFIATTFWGCMHNDIDIKLLPVKSGDKWGYINKEGKFIINAQFDLAYTFSDGLALVKSSDGKYGYIGEDGKYVVNPTYKNANQFSEGLACVVMENGKPQYINKEGKILFTVENSQTCGGFHEGLAPVKIKGKWGYIDTQGKIIINPEYEDANKFSESLAAVAKIDIKTKEKKWGFIDKKGGIKIDFQFKEDTANWATPQHFSEGLAFVSSDGKKWGCVNSEGKYQINPQFESAFFQRYIFKNGVSVIKQGDNYGYIDKTGKYVINPQFLNAMNFSSNGLAAVENSDKKYGFIDKEGRYVINPQFDQVVMGYINDVAFVKSSDKYGLINEKGTYVVNPQFDDIEIWSLVWTYLVENDYINNSDLAKSFLKNSDEYKIRNISTYTTLQDLVDTYPSIPTSDLKDNSLLISNPALTIDDILKVEELEYYFQKSTFSNIPTYKNVQKYNYWSGGYNTVKEFDHYEKKYNFDSKVTVTHFRMKLLCDGSGKSQKFAEELRDDAIIKMKMSLKTHPETNNDNQSGIFILSNDNLLMKIYYFEVKSKDDKTVTPFINTIVVNKNFEANSFDEIEKTMVASYLEARKKEGS